MANSKRHSKKRVTVEQQRRYSEYQKFFSWVIAERKFISFLYDLIMEADSKYYEWYNSIVFFLMNFGEWSDEKGFVVKCTKEEFQKQFEASYDRMKKVFEVNDTELDETMNKIKDKFLTNSTFAEEEK